MNCLLKFGYIIIFHLSNDQVSNKRNKIQRSELSMLWIAKISTSPVSTLYKRNLIVSRDYATHFARDTLCELTRVCGSIFSTANRFTNALYNQFPMQLEISSEKLCVSETNVRLVLAENNVM